MPAINAIKSSAQLLRESRALQDEEARFDAQMARLDREFAEEARQRGSDSDPRPQLKPVSLDERTGNELRPVTFDQMKGQQRLKGLLRRIVANALRTGRPLDHALFVGESGTGKTTTAMVMANECKRRVFMLKAPLDLATFEALADTCKDGDVVIVDEIHQVSSGDRRGLTQSADPETWFAAMEDHRLATPHGIIPFPKVTFIGCTTDAGLLPEPFLNRFPLKLGLDPYTAEQMAELAASNAQTLGLTIDQAAALVFAKACRRNPRQLNAYIKNARSLDGHHIAPELAREVVVDLNGTTLDGLTTPMQQMLKVLLRAERTSKGETVYTASVNTIATALGFSRDTKHVALFVEPELIRLGFVQVTPSGRALTPAGVERARQLQGG